MATFDFKGQEVTVLAQHAMELRDLSWIKEHFQFSGLVELEDAMGNLDPDAWRAVLLASIRRVNPEVGPKADGIDGVALIPLIEQMNGERLAYLEDRQAAEEKKAVRPTSRRTRAPRGGQS